MSYTHLLRKIQMFSGLGDRHLGEIESICRSIRVAKDKVLFRKGDQGGFCYGILAGQVLIELGDADMSSRVPVTVRNVGEVVGEFALLPNHTRTANARTTVESVLLRIDGSSLERLIRQNPELSLAMIDNLTGKLRESVHALASVQTEKIQQRIARLIHDLACSEGHDARTGHYQLQRPITHQQIADMLGYRRETVTRTLKHDFDGVLSTRYRSLCIVDPKRLRSLAEIEK